MPEAPPHQINSLDEMIEVMFGAGAGIRLCDVDVVVRVGMAKAVKLWVDAEHDHVPIMLSRDALEFGSDARWIRRQLRCRLSRRVSKRRQHLAAVWSSPCYLCGESLSGMRGVNLDHWYPRSLGGPDELWNLRVVHVVCNARKGDSVLPEAEAAYQAWISDRPALSDSSCAAH